MTNKPVLVESRACWLTGTSHYLKHSSVNQNEKRLFQEHAFANIICGEAGICKDLTVLLKITFYFIFLIVFGHCQILHLYNDNVMTLYYVYIIQLN